MKLKIDRLVRKEIQTKNGPAMKVNVLSGKTWYSCFDHPLTRTWREGQEIEVEVTQRGEYWNIILPKVERASQGSELAEIKEELKAIRELVGKLAKQAFLPDLEPPEEL